MSRPIHKGSYSFPSTSSYASACRLTPESCFPKELVYHVDAFSPINSTPTPTLKAESSPEKTRDRGRGSLGSLPSENYEYSRHYEPIGSGIVTARSYVPPNRGRVGEYNSPLAEAGYTRVSNRGNIGETQSPRLWGRRERESLSYNPTEDGCCSCCCCSKRDICCFFFGVVVLTFAVAGAVMLWIHIMGNPGANHDTPPHTVSVTNNSTGPFWMSVEWQQPTSEDSVLRYDLAYRLKNSSTWTDIPLSNPLIYSYNLTSLYGASTYSFRVRAANLNGTSNWTSVEFITQVAIIPSPPREPQTVSVSSASQGVSGDSDLIVEVQAAVPSNGGAPVKNMTVETSALDESTDEWSTWSPFCGSSADVGNGVFRCKGHAKAGTIIKYRAYAENSKGKSDAGDPAVCAHKLGSDGQVIYALCLDNVPTQVTAQPYVSVNEVTLQWDPACEDTLAVSSYEVQADGWYVYNSTNSTEIRYRQLSTINVANGALIRRATVSELLPATTYHFRVRAQSLVGAGPWSDTVHATAPENGKCGNTGDVANLKKHFKSMIDSLSTCIIENLTNQTAMQQCIEDAGGFTPACAGCWMDLGLCRRAGACNLKCATDQHSPQCIECAKQKCYPSIVQCTGIPSKYFPT